MIIRGSTKVVGLLGWPVEQSLSPALQNTAFETLGLDYCYVTFSVHHNFVGDAVRGIRALGIAGANVTIPHKEAVIPFLDMVDDEAAFIGAVNTITNRDGILTGHNTDGRGFMESLAEAGIDVQDRRVLILGAGGAAKAVGYYLCGKAEEVFLYNRHIARAVKLSASLGSIRQNVTCIDAGSLNDRTFFRTIDVIVNATSLGLKPQDALPVDPGLRRDRRSAT